MDMVLAGSIADRVGRRRIFLVGLAVFGLGSLLFGLAPSIGWLIAARALQPVGGTMLNPVALAIVATTFPDRAHWARAIGVFGSVSGLSLALGPILAGTLVDSFGWHSIFWINVPIVAAAIACTARRECLARWSASLLPQEVRTGQGCRRRPTFECDSLGWTSPVIPGLLAVAGLGGLGIRGYGPRRVDPLLEPRLFRSVPLSSEILMALFALAGGGAGRGDRRWRRTSAAEQRQTPADRVDWPTTARDGVAR